MVPAVDSHRRVPPIRAQCDDACDDDEMEEEDNQEEDNQEEDNQEEDKEDSEEAADRSITMWIPCV